MNASFPLSATAQQRVMGLFSDTGNVLESLYLPISNLLFLLQALSLKMPFPVSPDLPRQQPFYSFCLL